MNSKHQESNTKRSSQSKNHQHFHSDDFDNRRANKQWQRQFQEKRQAQYHFDDDDNE